MLKTRVKTAAIKTHVLFLFYFLLLGSISCTKNNDKPSSITTFMASLSASQETPSTAETGTGTLTATYDESTNILTYTLTWTGLTGNPVAMHFHKGAAGQAGDVEIPITGFPVSAAGTLTTTATVDAGEEGDLLEEKFYVNIHTANHPAGEIRGQLLKN